MLHHASSDGLAKRIIFDARRKAPMVFAVFLALAVPSQLGFGDVIYLKNGQKIVGTVLSQDKQHVEYEREGDEYSIPRSIVDHIEKSSAPPSDALPAQNSRALSPNELPLPPLAKATPGEDSPSPVVMGNRLDKALLRSLDEAVLRHPNDENRNHLGLVYRQAAEFLRQSGKPEEAIDLCRHGLAFAPNDLNLTLTLGQLLIIRSHYNEAIELLRPAENQFPKSPDLPLLLGSAYFYSESLDRAIEEWMKSLGLRDDPRVRAAITKTEQERDAASSYQEMRSEHFLLRHQGGAGLKPLGDQVLQTLEAAFKDLEMDLDSYPQEIIVVLLYPDQIYRDITRVPSWVGALYDGKIRVPVSGLSSMTPDLARTLKHELTHSFVRQATSGRCPVWFNEGVAQLEEGASTARFGVQLARALARGQTTPFSTLENSFLEMRPDQVTLAYAKSLAALQYLRDTYGMPEVRRLLRMLARSPDISSLLLGELRIGYAEFEQAVATYVENRYGS